MLLSANSMASRWVVREIEYADEKQKSIVVLRMDETPLPRAIFYLERRDYIDGRSLAAGRDLSSAAADKLARTLRLSAPSAPPPAAPAVSVRKQIDTPAGRLTSEWTPTPPGKNSTPLALIFALVTVALAVVVIFIATRSSDGGEVATPAAIAQADTATPLPSPTPPPSVTPTHESVVQVTPEATMELTAPPEATQEVTAEMTPEPEATEEATVEVTPELDLTAMLNEQAGLTAVLDSQAALINWEPVLEEFDGVIMAQVPAGCFMMGAEGFTSDELPVHPVCVEAFWIDVLETSSALFNTWGATAAEPDPAPGDYPRLYLMWQEAADYCALRGARLPTEAEWEFAARGPFSQLYPWGSAFDASLVAANPLVPALVQEYADGASWVGALNMVGNAMEWTSTRFAPYPYNANDGREDPPTTSLDQRVQRGGGYLTFNVPEFLNGAVRIGSLIEPASLVAGVRCARDLGDVN